MNEGGNAAKSGQGFFTISLLPVDLHPHKILFSPRCKNIRNVLRIWGQNNGNYSNIVKINAPLNQWPEIHLYKNQCNSKLTPSFEMSDNLVRH